MTRAAASIVLSCASVMRLVASTGVDASAVHIRNSICKAPASREGAMIQRLAQAQPGSSQYYIHGTANGELW
jgi:hypothetical protein